MFDEWVGDLVYEMDQRLKIEEKPVY